jgi:hypothetical protein
MAYAAAMRVRAAWWILGLVGACARPVPSAPSTAEHVANTAVSAGERSDVGDLARGEDGEGGVGSSDADALSSPDALMWSVLRGEPTDLDTAEAALEAQLEQAMGDRRVALAVRLGRFYNVRALRGDATKASRQAELYVEVLGGRSPSSLDFDEFRAWCFSQLGALLAQRNEGRMLAAMATVKRVEDALADRVAATPDDVELRALAGNFAVFFAGNVPFDKQRRTELAAEHLGIVQARWDEMRAVGRDPDHCPNTRISYAFELAEAELALGHSQRAESVYAWIVGREASDDGAAVDRQFATIAADRMQRLDALSGDMGLMPPWPSDAENCVVCHGSRALSLESLYSPPASLAG